MAAPLANHAAAVAAGYKSTVTDRGAAFLPAAERWKAQLAKPIIGDVGQSGGEFRAEGYGSSQVNAETASFNALNGQRQIRYGLGSASSGKGSHGGTLVDDLG